MRASTSILALTALVASSSLTPFTTATTTTGKVNCFARGAAANVTTLKTKLTTFCDTIAWPQDLATGGDAFALQTITQLWDEDGSEIRVNVKVRNDGTAPWTPKREDCQDTVFRLVDTCHAARSWDGGAYADADEEFTIGGWAEMDEAAGGWIGVDPNSE